MLDDSTSDRGSDRPEVLNAELPPGQWVDCSMFTHDDEDLGVEGSDRLLEGVAGVEIVEGGEAAGAVAPQPARGRGGGLGHEKHDRGPTIQQ